jgi:hypothetical protein
MFQKTKRKKSLNYCRKILINRIKLFQKNLKVMKIKFNKSPRLIKTKISRIFSINHSARLTIKKRNTSMRSWWIRNSGLNYGTEDPEMAGSMQTSTEWVMGWVLLSLSSRSKKISNVLEASLALSGHHLKMVPLSLTALPCSST